MTTETQVYNYLNHVLNNMKVSPNLIQKEANFLFDFNFSVQKMDALYSNIEQQYHLPFIRFSPDVATIEGLMHYILSHNNNG